MLRLLVSAMLFPVLMALAPTTAAQAPQGLDEFLAPIRERHRVPALGAAVLVDGRLAAIGVSGKRKHGSDAEVTVDDRWHLGSCTKAMTATLLARHVDRGRLSWNDTVAERMPDLLDGMHAQARAITVADLLRHRAGQPRGPSRALWNELFRFEGSDRDARTAVAAELLQRAPTTAPGTRYLYSNAGYMIVGAIAERIDERPWSEQMRAELFDPLAMRSAGFGPPGRRDAVEEPWGHRPGPRGPVPVFHDNPSSLGPAGTVHASLRDWARFVGLHLGVCDPGRQPLVRDATLRTLHTPPDGTDYAFGWRVTRRGWAPGPILTHSGSNTMWYCVAWLAPEIDFAVLVTCNQGDAAGACDEVAAACIRRFRRD